MGWGRKEGLVERKGECSVKRRRRKRRKGMGRDEKRYWIEKKGKWWNGAGREGQLERVERM